MYHYFQDSETELEKIIHHCKVNFKKFQEPFSMMSYDVLEKQNHHLQLNIFQFEIKKKKIMSTPASLVEFQGLDIRTRVAWKAS